MSTKFTPVTEEPPPRPSLAEGTTAHYDDAGYYDESYQDHRADVTFYLQTALEHGGPVLELGCGTGRITLPLARAGIDVVGVDASEEMLEAAQDKLDTQSEDVQRCVTLAHADIRAIPRSVAPDRAFRLVISPFNVLQHLYTLDDLERCFAGVRRCLMPRKGLFAFDVLLPDVRALGRNPARRYKLGQVHHPAGDTRYDYEESFDYDPIAQVQYIGMYFEHPDDRSLSFSTPLTHRQFFPEELRALVRYNGFEAIHRYGSFDREPILETSDSQIYVCRLGPKRR